MKPNRQPSTDRPSIANVGAVVPHDSATGHVQGTAPYIDDLVPRADELQVGFVGSPVAAGKLTGINAAAALEIPGVVAVFTADDVDGENAFGPHFHDEPFLAVDRLLYVGQPVALVAATSRDALHAARGAIEVQCDSAPPILSIEKAIGEEKYIGPLREIKRGTPEDALETAPHRLNGVFACGGQEQFYLESQAAIAYPSEDGQLVVHSSTQNPTEIQVVVAEVLGLHQHDVICECKRMGGAFGGKETQAALPALMAALVAKKTGRSARVVYEKDDDMQITGKRHGYRFEWDVGFDGEGRIEALTMDLYSNGGAAADLSLAVMERSMLHVDNAYFLPHARICGRVCFTNYPPNTAFRGFGGPQAIAATENILERIAEHLGVDALDVRRTNLYGDDPRNVAPYGQIVRRNHLPEIIDRLVDSCDYRRRRDDVVRRSRESATHVAGIALTPVKFGISFTTKFLNQGNALVNVYTDGTVQVSTGGTEMGQGLNTKIRQLVADEFGLPWRDVRVMTTSTEKNNNTSPTAASAGTDLNGAAAVDAARQIKQRLSEFAARHFASIDAGFSESPQHARFADAKVFDARHPQESLPFGEFVAMAHRERVDLGARGFYATPGVDFNRETGRGNPFLYYTQGAAVSEVLIDRYTGQMTVPRVDLLIDIGKSINPGVDMGQVTGGFIQGMGWVTAEDLVYDDEGRLLSYSPTTYKIPAITDVPREFVCQFFDNDDNRETVARSKAVGEPPLMLGIAVWAAVKHALSQVSSAASDELRLPATGEEILRCLEIARTADPQSPSQKRATRVADGTITHS